MSEQKPVNPANKRDRLGTRQEILSRYTDQPERMPPAVRDQIERLWNSQPVQLYAMADLDASMRLGRTWLAVGPEQVAVAREKNGETNELVVETFTRDRVKGVRVVLSLSCNALHLLGDPGDPPLAVLRYTHRQRHAIENVKFLLEHKPDEAALKPQDPDEVYAEAVSKPFLEAQAAVAGRKLAVVWRLMGYLKPYWGRMTVGTAAAILMTAVSLLPNLFTKRLIDDVIRPFQSGSLTREKAIQLAMVILGAVGATYVLRAVCLWARLQSLAYLGEFVARDLRRKLYEHLQTLSLQFYSQKQTGSIISRVSHDTDRLWDFVAFGLVEVTLAVFMLLGLGGILIWLDFQLGLIMILPVPLLLWAFFAHGDRMRHLFMRAWRKWTRVTEVLSDTIPGMRVVKAFHQEDYETKRFCDRNSAATSQFLDIHDVWTKFWPGIVIGLHAMTLLVWALALPRVLRPDSYPGAMSFGTFMAFVLYMGMFFGPIETIGMITRMLNRATSSALRIFEILDTEPDVKDVPEPVQLDPVQGHVLFENVTFAYDGIRPVIKDVSFEVQPGEMIGLVGPSGAGKTTVTNLLVRFYEVTAGRICIDGVDLRQLDTGHLRRQIGMVLQDPHLFHGTIFDNIRYGVRDATVERIIAASKAANAHEFICRLPHGYDTVVGERGHTLSGGERQRVSIARAVLCEPRILILDEATSSVDTETERKIQEALERLVKGRTVFAIAHRLSTLRRADRLIVLEEGRVTETGTHAELLSKENGTYKKLHDMQQELHEMYAV